MGVLAGRFAGFALQPPRPARANDFVDTRLNLTLTNENVLTRPGETNPPVPGWRFDRPSNLGVLFFDNYDTRFTGYESLTHIVLFKSIQRQRWEAEAAYVLRHVLPRSLAGARSAAKRRMLRWQKKSPRAMTPIPSQS